ncbi:MAG: hypothetical protein ACRDHK_10355, partial [Actinomycetota bacterium]
MTGRPSPDPWEVSRGRYVPIGDTRLFVLELGEGYPLIALHRMKVNPSVVRVLARRNYDPIDAQDRLAEIRRPV